MATRVETRNYCVMFYAVVMVNDVDSEEIAKAEALKLLYDEDMAYEDFDISVMRTTTASFIIKDSAKVKKE